MMISTCGGNILVFKSPVEAQCGHTAMCGQVPRPCGGVLDEKMKQYELSGSRCCALDQ